VMQEDPQASPIQVFVGLDSGSTPAERVDLALAEMDRTEAWSRSLLLLVSPTGTGYVNYVATACVQYLTRGDVASVTLQYSKRPSPLSLGKVKAAAEQNRLLWLRIFERVRAMSPADRPKVVLFGESLGAFYAYKFGLEVLCLRIGNVSDQPTNLRLASIWLKPEDLVQLIRIGLEHPDIRYEIFYGVSANTRGWWDNSVAYRFGYKPSGDSETLIQGAREGQAKLAADPVGDYYQGGHFASQEFDGGLEQAPEKKR